MWRVERPTMSAVDAFETCINSIQDINLLQRLRVIRSEIELAANDYIEKAEQHDLHQIEQQDRIASVSDKEMQKIYKSGMVKSKVGRRIYDQLKLLPKNDRCPFCGHRNVATLDHVLTKEKYPVFAVTPVNLVACCSDCNKAKGRIVPTSAFDTIMHPYFDDPTQEQWLFGEVVEQLPPAVIFRVEPVVLWDDVMNARVRHQFDLLKLDSLYSNQAANELANIRHNLQRYFETGGQSAVQDELKLQWESRRENQINSWQTALYEALSKSDWFCNRGFAEGFL